MRRSCGETRRPSPAPRLGAPPARRESGLGRPLRGRGGAGQVGPEFKKTGASGGERSEGRCSTQGGEGERLWSLPH